MPAIPSPQNQGPLRLLHNEYRTALLNRKYYGCRLARFQTLNKWFEGLIAVGASGSGVAGLALWKTETGVYVWGAISGASIILAVLKPIIGLSKEIERYSKLAGEYASLSESLRQIEADVTANQEIRTEQVDAFRQLLGRNAELSALDDQHPDRNLIKRLQEEVISETSGALWVPK